MRKQLPKRYFYIKNDDTIIVEPVLTQKEIFEWLDHEIENIQDGYMDDSCDTYMILYKDGTEDYILISEYDGHKIRRNNILSMVFSNDESYVVYGAFEMNEYGSVVPSEKEYIDSSIMEVEKLEEIVKRKPKS